MIGSHYDDSNSTPFPDGTAHDTPCTDPYCVTCSEGGQERARSIWDTSFVSPSMAPEHIVALPHFSLALSPAEYGLTN